MNRYKCPVCDTEREVFAMGPYTITLTCGATLFKGRPDPESEIDTTWWSFDWRPHRKS